MAGTSLSMGGAAAGRVLVAALLWLALGGACLRPAAAQVESSPPPGLELDWQGRQARVRRAGHYEMTLDLERGATISSLKLGQLEGTELTGWKWFSWGGLLGEAHTADVPFRLTRQEAGAAGSLLECEASRGDLRVRKRFEFSASSPTVRVSMEFENTGSSPLSGTAAPAMCNLVLPAGGESSGSEYYCLERGRGPEALTAATVLRGLRPWGAGGGPLMWLTVTDPAGLKGLGFVFADDAARSVWAERGPDGEIMLWWRYSPLPPGQVLRTELLVVPIEGLAAVSWLSERFAADTTVAPAREASLEVNLRLMPIAGDVASLTVVSRTYGPEGKELEPCEALAFEDLQHYKVTRRQFLILPSAPRKEWLLHEMYVDGKRVGSYPVRLREGQMPPSLAPAPPGAAVVGPAGDSADGLQTDGQSGLLIWQEDGAPPRKMGRALNVDLMAGEKETLFFGMRALKAVPPVKLSVVADPAGAGRGIRPLHPAAAFLRAVRPGPDGMDCLVPMTDLTLAEGDAAWVALLLDATPLEPGTYGARLFFQGLGAPVEVPLTVNVSRAALRPRDGFALWFVDTGLDAEPVGRTEASRLVSYTVCALGVPASRAPADVRKAWAWGLDMLGFHSPGEGVGVAQRSRLGEGVLNDPHMPAPPFWMLWSAFDDLRAADELSRLGLVEAVVVRRPDELPTLRAGGRARLALVEGGCGPGGLEELAASGRVAPGDSLWLYVDLGGADWRREIVDLRASALAAASQGLAGMAVSCPRPLKEGDRQMALWHVLRDVREEAALLAMAAGRAQDAQALDLETGELQARRAAAVLEVGSLVGAGGSRALLWMRQEAEPFRKVMKVGAPDSSDAPPLEAFGAARKSALKAWLELESLPGMDRPWPNLYWHGVAMLRDGRMRWGIVSLGGGAAEERARGLQATIDGLTGVKVPIGYSMPRLDGAAPEDLPDLLWIAADTTELAGLPDVLRRALAGVESGGSAALRLPEGPWAVVLGEGADLKALRAALTPAASMWRTSAGVE